MLLRISCSPTHWQSIPSIVILPPSGSASLSNAATSDDFPAPVRPTTPTYAVTSPIMHVTL